MSDPDFGVPQSDEEIEALAEATRLAFGHAKWTQANWPKALGTENLRVLRDRGKVAASLGLIPMGQWFGGRSVPMAGVTAVSVMPEMWRRGLASTLMRSSLIELHDSGVAISSLYPASLALYRRQGYEMAGARYKLSIEARSVGFSSRELEIRPIVDDDGPVIEELNNTSASKFPGHLDRHPFVWATVRQAWSKGARGYLVHDSGRPEGYVYFAPSDAGSGYDLDISDLVFLTERAGRRLLAFLGDHGGVGRYLSWYSSPTDPALLLIPEARYRMGHYQCWMTRIVEIVAALEARGYPAGLDSEVLLRVSDNVLPANSGSFALRVANGRGTVERQAGGTGLDIDIRALAALYTGHRSPQQLEIVGGLSGDPAELAKVEAIFAGPAPWLTEMF